MVIRTNIQSLTAWRNAKNTGLKQRRSAARLASGNRINSAADDAAGLAISENMYAQIRGLNQAYRNTRDGIALLQTMDGGLDGIGAMLIRKREITIQALNDTYTIEQKRMIQMEICQLIAETDGQANRVEFNSMRLLNWRGASRSVRWTGSVGIPGAPGTPGGGTPSFTLGPSVPGVTIDNALIVGSAWDMYVIQLEATIDPGAGTNNLISFTLQQGSLGRITMIHGSFNYDDDMRRHQMSIVAPDGTIFGFHPGSVADLEGGMNNTPVTSSSATVTIEASPQGGGVNAIGLDIWIRDISAHGAGEWTIMLHNMPESEASTFGVWIITEPDPDFVPPPPPPPPEAITFFSSAAPAIWIQTGASSLQGVHLPVFDVRARSLGVSRLDVTTHISANAALDAIDNAITQVNGYRATIGALINRLEHTGRSLLISSENLQDSRSRIKDADIAREMMQFTKTNILQQTAIAMLAQANRNTDMVLQLLR